VGVSESHLKLVRNYILQQEEHHAARSFADEIDEFMKKYGWALIEPE
jgi:putative transposase